jgi:hypothetical protein
LEGVSASEWGSQTENPTRNERWRTGNSIDWTATGTAWKETWDADIAIPWGAAEVGAFLAKAYVLDSNELSNTMLPGEVSLVAPRRVTVAGCPLGCDEAYYVKSILLASQS